MVLQQAYSRFDEGSVERKRGLSLVEVIIAIGIISTVLIAMIVTFQTLATLGEHNKLRSYALFLGNEHLEKIRSMSYDTIGTVAGLPSGSIPQLETITYDGHEYTRRTFIQYVDDPADGTDAGDTLTADYKRVKVELSYTYRGTLNSFSFVTTIAPKSLESLAGAGVLRIHVNDSDNQPVYLSSVHIVNTSVATSVDITTFTNASGTISFPGAWAGGGYEIYVSKSGYSDAQTYLVSVANPNPSPSPLNVAENSVTEIYFKIDPLASMEVLTQSLPTRSRFIDDFADTSGIDVQTNIQVSGGIATLSGSPGTYPSSGSVTTIPMSPASLGEWLLLITTVSVPASTDVRAHIEYDTGGGVFAPIPDSDLPGNAVGFSGTIVDLGTLDTSVYTTLRVTFELESSDPNISPEVDSYKLSYHETPNILPNVSIAFQGSKTIGTDAGGNPIYKYDQTIQTSGAGIWSSGPIDSDVYTVQTPGFDVAEACPSVPITLEPGMDLRQTLTLVTNTANTLTVQVTSISGTVVPRAEVRITGGMTDETRSTGPCGLTHFTSLNTETYTMDIDAPGFSHYTQTVPVSGNTTYTATLTP